MTQTSETQTPDIEDLIAQRMAAQWAAHRAMIDAQIEATQAGLQSEADKFNKMQESIANAQREQEQRLGRLDQQGESLQKLIALRDQMFPPAETPSSAPDTLPAEAPAQP